MFDPPVSTVGLDGMTPHALRHTAASLAIDAGANVKVVQQMLGHKSATMTLDLYGHLLADQARPGGRRDAPGAGSSGLSADVWPKTVGRSTPRSCYSRIWGDAVSAPGRIRTCNLLIRSHFRAVSEAPAAVDSGF